MVRTDVGGVPMMTSTSTCKTCGQDILFTRVTTFSNFFPEAREGNRWVHWTAPSDHHKAVPR